MIFARNGEKLTKNFWTEEKLGADNKEKKFQENAETGHRALGFLAGLQVSVEIVVQVFAGRGRLLGFSFATATSATATNGTSTSARGSPSRPSLAASAAGAKRFSDSAAGAESQNGTTVRTVIFFYTLVSAVPVPYLWMYLYLTWQYQNQSIYF